MKHVKTTLKNKYELFFRKSHYRSGLWYPTGLLELALEKKDSLERRRRNLDEAIDNFDERSTDISTEHTAVLALLAS